MKKLSASILAIAFSTAAFTAKAENVERIFKLEGTNINITSIDNSKSIVVSFNNTANGDMTIALEDVNGSNFAADKVKPSAYFAKKYNLAQLETGKYRIVVTKNSIKTVQPFELTSKAVVLNELERKDKFVPAISQKDKKLDVNVLLGNYSNVTVKIYNNEGRLVFENKNYVVLTVNKRYDLSKMDVGTYIVEILAGDETERFTINL